jgi:hypothetical protein
MASTEYEDFGNELSRDSTWSRSKTSRKRKSRDTRRASVSKSNPNPLDPFAYCTEDDTTNASKIVYEIDELESGSDSSTHEESEQAVRRSPRLSSQRDSFLRESQGSDTDQSNDSGNESGGEYPLLHKTFPQVHKRRKMISSTYGPLYTNPSVIHAQRERQTFLNAPGPSRSSGERALRQTYEPPIDDEEEERQINNDRGLLLACPVPPPEQVRREREFPETNQQDCFGCMARIANHVSPRYEALKEFVDFYKDNVTVPPHILAVYLSQKYNEIRDSHNDSIQRNFQCVTDQHTEKLLLPEWDKASIYEHITKHISIQPSVFVRKNFARLEEMNEILISQGIYRVDPRNPQRIIVNTRCAELLTRNIILQQRLLSTPIHTMNFHDPGTTPSTSQGFVTARGHVPATTGTSTGGLLD